MINSFSLKNRKCIWYSENPEFLLIEPLFTEELEKAEERIRTIRSKTDVPFAYTAFEVWDWNKELSPWPAPAVFGKEEFGEGAGETLGFIVDDLIPYVCSVGNIPDDHCILGGYSLAGLFALWSVCRCNRFVGCVGASPSVWFPEFTDYVKEQGIKADAVYLSLGNKEEKTRNKVMSMVGDRIRELHQLLSDDPDTGAVILEWNEGNHFREPIERTAKGFAWCLNTLYSS